MVRDEPVEVVAACSDAAGMRAARGATDYYALSKMNRGLFFSSEIICS